LGAVRGEMRGARLADFVLSREKLDHQEGNNAVIGDGQVSVRGPGLAPDLDGSPYGLKD
jgi:hypothetical protein